LIERFRGATAITAEPPVAPARSIAEVIEDIWNNRDPQYNTRCLVKRLQRINKDMSAEARELFKPYLPGAGAPGVPGDDLGTFAASLSDLLSRRFTDTMKVLRDKQFQELLVRYPRQRDPFIRADGVQDTVSTEWLIRAGVGEKYRPEDYLAMFARFVKENPAHIEAIGILLDRPRDWSTAALTELRNKLTQTRERFTPELLQKAHEAHYHKSLVDIISMVKHAAKDNEPLLTAQERVGRAFDKLAAGKTFSAAQQQWLDRIRAHLVENLSIDREDFDVSPVLERPGGWTAADRAFDGKLAQWLREVNEAVAA
jgi:type I restriction enzyme R subunit